MVAVCRSYQADLWQGHYSVQLNLDLILTHEALVWVVSLNLVDSAPWLRNRLVHYYQIVEGSL